jgi:hypothetical protein
VGQVERYKPIASQSKVLVVSGVNCCYVIRNLCLSLLKLILIINPALRPRSKNAWSYTSIPPIRLNGIVIGLKKARGQLYLHLHLHLPHVGQFNAMFDTVLIRLHM